MTRKYLWLVLCATLLLFAACEKAPELTLTSLSSIELGVEGGSCSISFTANRDWSVSSSDSWVTVSPSSGTASDGTVTVSVRCSANTTYDDRTATVTIRMEGLSQSVTVRQPSNLGVVLPKQTFDLQSGANTIDVEVQANVQYSVSTSVDWIKQTGTKGLTSNTLTFSIEENKTYDPREGKITIKPQNGSAQEQVISVKQAQKDALNVEKTSYNMPYGGGQIEIKVEANVSFDVTPNAEWIHHLETKALSNSTVSLKIDENATPNAREGKVEIKQKNGNLKHVITINQTGFIAVTSVELNKTTLTLIEGDSETLTATVKPDNATDKTLTWSTSDSQVATVENGKITAIRAGSATISVKAGEQQASCVVTVDKSLALKYKTTTGTMIDLSKYHDYLSHYYDSESGYNVITFRNNDSKSLPGWFSKNSEVVEVIIPDGIETICDEAFLSCSHLASVTLPSSVTKIGARSFMQCSSLASIILPEALTSLGDWAFMQCSGLLAINIPRTITCLGECIFTSCTSLVVVSLPDSLTQIGASCFGGCELLSSITIPPSVTVIGPHAFANTGLVNVTVPEGVTEIRGYAFIDCTGLTNISLPTSLKILGMGAFRNCTGLTEIIIPNETTEIGESVFSECKNLKSVSLPEGLTRIPDRMFEYCDRLESVGLPKNLTEIGERAFYCCGHLRVTLPEGLTTIGASAFGSCHHLGWVAEPTPTPTIIVIPSTVTKIGDRAFNNLYTLVSGGTAPAGFKILPPSPPQLGEYALPFAADIPNYAILYVPADKVEVYKSAEGWSYYKDQIRAIPEE